MLIPMDIAAAPISAASASAAPWLAAGALLTLAALLLAGVVTALVLRRRSAMPAEEVTPRQEPVVDDLPGFLESPPGSTVAAPAVDPPVAPHAALAPPLTAPPLPGGRPPTTPPARPRSVPAAVLAGVAGLAVLLVVAAAVVLTSADSSRGPDSRADRQADGGRPRPPAEVRMSFAGVVLEQRAVGVTATYPEVELTADRDGAVARLTLPTWNCLSAEAPDDPEAAGCVPARTEHAELRPPELEVTRSGGGLSFGGRFPTSTRPTGSGPEPTGRSYPVEVSIRGESDLCSGRRSPADGVLVLGTREAASVEGEIHSDC